MKLKKIIAATLAAAVVATTCAISAFATTIALDSESKGAWDAGKTIAKTDLEAIGGNVKITLEVEAVSGLLAADQHIFKPMDYDNSWTTLYTEGTTDITSDTAVIKGDGFIAINQDATSVDFVVSADKIATLGDSGIGFQVNNVWVKSATLELADAPAAAFKVITDEEVADYCFGAADAPAATENAPAGNTSAAVLVSVMALAGVAMAATKIKK